MSSLADALDLSLEVGELVQLSGGHTARVIQQMEATARALGAEECHPAVSSINVSMTLVLGGERLTGGRHAGHMGINFATLTALRRLITDLEQLGLSADQFRARLLLIRNAAPVYPTWLVMLALGGSGAAFAALFGATAVGVLLTMAGSWAGAWVRFLLVRRHQPPFVCVASAALVSALIVAGGAGVLGLSEAAMTPALAAAALFLVPGVPMLNGTADLLSAHYLNGVVRLAMSAVIIGSAATGLVAGVSLIGSLS